VTPAKRLGRPPGTKKPKPPAVRYRCRYGCPVVVGKDGGLGIQHNVNLRKHMMRVHGIFSNQHPTVLVHHCGRRYSPAWGELNCNKRDKHCKALKEGTAEWFRHHVQAPCTEQEAADTFAYESGTQPSDLVVIRPEHDEGERKQAIKAAYDLSVAQAAAAAEAVAAAEAAAAAAAEAVAAQVYNGPPSAGSSPDQGIAIDDEDDEEDAEFEVEDEYEQGPPAKRRRM
jgi:hypothetical protein